MTPREFICRTCCRVVDAELEPSPGEPTHCPDCHAHNQRENPTWRWGTEDALDRDIADGLEGWGAA